MQISISCIFNEMYEIKLNSSDNFQIKPPRLNFIQPQGAESCRLEAQSHTYSPCREHVCLCSYSLLAELCSTKSNAFVFLCDLSNWNTVKYQHFELLYSVTIRLVEKQIPVLRDYNPVSSDNHTADFNVNWYLNLCLGFNIEPREGCRGLLLLVTYCLYFVFFNFTMRDFLHQINRREADWLEGFLHASAAFCHSKRHL